MQEAYSFLYTVRVGPSILLHQNDFQDVISAAPIKADYPLSFADCFSVATARREDAIILTGDPEFKKIEHLTKIGWLSGRWHSA